jgi:hypothetical protein
MSIYRIETKISSLLHAEIEEKLAYSMTNRNYIKMTDITLHPNPGNKINSIS